MEFKIITDLTTLPQIIETNAEELKAWLGERMEHYSGLVVTPDTIQSAKEDKAALNKLRAALEERRKEVKRQCMAPYEAFEQKYKELLALIDAPITSIDTQVKAFEEQAQQEKYAKIRQYFEEITKELDFQIDLDRILDPKWKNKTNSIEKICRKLFDDVENIKDDRRELVGYYADSPHFTAIMNCYMQGYDKACALAYAAALIQQEQREQAQRAAQQPHSEPEPTPPPEDTSLPEPPVQEPPAPSSEKLYELNLRYTGTADYLRGVLNYLTNSPYNGFEIVKKER